MKIETKEQSAKKFLAKVRKRVRELKICLQPSTFVSQSPRRPLACCALGAALALKAKTKTDLIDLSREVGRGDRPSFLAKVLNGGTETNDMFQLECGFEGWNFGEFRPTESGGHAGTDKAHPFYLAGKRLRADADKTKRPPSTKRPSYSSASSLAIFAAGRTAYESPGRWA